MIYSGAIFYILYDEYLIINFTLIIVFTIVLQYPLKYGTVNDVKYIALADIVYRIVIVYA